MKIIESEIRAVNKRLYKQFAKLQLEDGDEIFHTNGFKFVAIKDGRKYFHPQIVEAERLVYKSGELRGFPRGKWSFKIKGKSSIYHYLAMVDLGRFL